MIGLGTIVNAAAIVVGGIAGHGIGALLKERFQKIINTAMALSVIAMSLSGAVSKMLVVGPASFQTQGTYTIIFSLVLGAITGELINIDGLMERFGVWLKKKTGSGSDAQFVDGFVSASLTVCVGAMAVIGAIMDGMTGDHSILFTKAVLDFFIVLIMAAAKGKGCIFSAIPVFIFQGAITLLAQVISPIFNTGAMDALSLVGSILILCVGINLLFDGKFRIKVANLLPAIIFAVVAAYIPFLQG